MNGRYCRIERFGVLRDRKAIELINTTKILLMGFDDVISSLKGIETGKPLISIWRHYPEHDLNLDKLVDITVRDNQRFPSDLIKLAPHARYCTMDFGCKITPGTSERGSTGASSCKNCVVKSINHWSRINRIDPLEGEYGRNIQYAKKIAEAFPDRPKMMTVFAPTMVARKLSRNQFIDHFVEDKSLVLDAFKIVNEVTIEYARACIDAGIDGIFVATQEADKTVAEDSNLSKQILKLNQGFNKIINQKALFSVLHIHGEEVHFEQALNLLNSTAINWHDTTSGYSITNISKRFKGGILAGLEPNAMLKGISRDEILEFRRKYIDLPFILSPGCVLLQGTEDKTLDLIFKHYKDN